MVDFLTEQGLTAQYSPEVENSMNSAPSAQASGPSNSRDEYFEQEATFDMGNGTTFTIWRRTVAPTRAEVEYYLSAFKEEDAQYPEMFSEIAESWLAARGL